MSTLSRQRKATRRATRRVFKQIAQSQSMQDAVQKRIADWVNTSLVRGSGYISDFYMQARRTREHLLSKEPSRYGTSMPENFIYGTKPDVIIIDEVKE